MRVATLFAAFFVVVAAAALLIAVAADAAPTWSCVTTSRRRILNSTATWSRMTCNATSVFSGLPIGPLSLNVVEAPMADPRFSARAVTAQNVSRISLAALSDIVAAANKQSGGAKQCIAAVNGGYFFELWARKFFDNVCIGKTYADAEANVSLAKPINGVGDGLTVQDGKILSTNCGCIGYNRPAVFDLDAFNITVQQAHDAPPAGVLNAYAAGPNLVSVHPNGTTYVDVPKDDENLNRFERSANTAVGFRRADRRLFMVTVDGYDGCPITEDDCGIDSWDYAVMMKDVFKCDQAMNNDQGGSTTMYVAGSGAKDGIVSCNNYPKSCPSGQREIFNALCLMF
jgi:exopolysaccharide biosynthesis protein